MEYYETQDDYTRQQINTFIKWFDTNIGTDYELNESASGEHDQFYLILSDLEGDEVQTIRDFETKFRVHETKD